MAQGNTTALFFMCSFSKNYELVLGSVLVACVVLRSDMHTYPSYMHMSLGMIAPLPIIDKHLPRSI